VARVFGHDGPDRGERGVALPEWSQWLALAGVSGFLGAVAGGSFSIANTAVSGRQQRQRQAIEQAGLRKHQEIDLDGQRDRQKLDIEGQLKRQQNEHSHQRMLLRQEAHFQARKESADLAGDAFSWINREAYEKHGPEVDLFPAELPARPYPTASGALFDLRKLQATHPTRAVREQANELADEIEASYNTIAPGGDSMERPSLDDVLSWRNKIIALIEAINEAPEVDG
jgi:hypothetical protein